MYSDVLYFLGNLLTEIQFYAEPSPQEKQKETNLQLLHVMTVKYNIFSFINNNRNSYIQLGTRDSSKKKEGAPYYILHISINYLLKIRRKRKNDRLLFLTIK